MHFLSLLLIINLFAISMENNYLPQQENTLSIFKSSASVNRADKKIDPALVDVLINDQPLEIRNWVTVLQDAELLREANRFLLLTGKPGVGKTKLSQAIPSKANVPFKFILSKNIGNKYQFSTQEMLNAELQSVMQTQTPFVIIIDEIAKLYKKNNVENADDTTEVLLQTMDECWENPNILFIGTTNEIKKIPETVKTRFAKGIVQIPLPNCALRNKIIKYYLATNHTLDERYINYLTKVTKGLGGRVIEKFIKDCRINALLRKSLITEVDCELILSQTDLISWNIFKKFSLNENQRKNIYSFVATTVPFVINSGIQIYGLIQNKKFHTEQMALTRELHNESAELTVTLHQDQYSFRAFERNLLTNVTSTLMVAMLVTQCTII